MDVRLDRWIGRRGYTVVARAPGVGVPGFDDGSWRIVAGEDPCGTGTMHEMDSDLIPFILSVGGDIVLYKLDPGERDAPVPVLRPGGMIGRPPSLSGVQPYDASAMEGLLSIRASALAKAVPPPSPAPRGAAFRRLPRGSILAGALASLAIALAVATGPAGLGLGTAEATPDLGDPKLAAQRAGAVEMVVVREGDPEFMDVYRVYPTSDGSVRRHRVDSFRRSHYEAYGSTLPPNPTPWLRPDGAKGFAPSAPSR